MSDEVFQIRAISVFKLEGRDVAIGEVLTLDRLISRELVYAGKAEFVGEKPAPRRLGTDTAKAMVK